MHTASTSSPVKAHSALWAQHYCGLGRHPHLLSFLHELLVVVAHHRDVVQAEKHVPTLMNHKPEHLFGCSAVSL
eukprot:m51a1_g6926 hypothetical protein (74) ;mRNA; r:176045-176622